MSACVLCAFFSVSTYTYLLYHCAIEGANVTMYILEMAVPKYHGYQRFRQRYNLILVSVRVRAFLQFAGLYCVKPILY